MAIMIATALHAIATGNMLPAFVTEPDGRCVSCRRSAWTHSSSS